MIMETGFNGFYRSLIFRFRVPICVWAQVSMSMTVTRPQAIAIGGLSVLFGVRTLSRLRDTKVKQALESAKRELDGKQFHGMPIRIDWGAHGRNPLAVSSIGSLPSIPSVQDLLSRERWTDGHGAEKPRQS